MAILSNTYGITLVVGTTSTEYGGAASNQFFGGASDRIAMLRYGAPDELAADEFIAAATFTGQFKADTAADSDTITIGLIDAAWTSTTTDYTTLFAYLEAETVTAALVTYTTAAEKTLDIAGILQTWAAAPASYSGIFFRCSTLSLARIGAADQSISTTVGAVSACGAPSTATLSASVVEADPTLIWSGATSGTSNAITGYKIEYSESTDGSAWGAWTALKTVTSPDLSGSTTVTKPGTRGYYRKYRIRTQGAAGASYYSAWKETTAVKYNVAPTVLTAFTATPAFYLSGAIALSYSGATDPDDGISGYAVEYAINGGSWVALSNNAVTHTPTLSDADIIKYHARAFDTLGALCATWLESNEVLKNSAPSAPVIDLPQNSKTIYNSRPRFLITIGADVDSQAQTLTAAGYTLSHSAPYNSGDQIILRRTIVATAGAVALSAIQADASGVSSSAATRSTTYAVPSYTDSTIASGTTAIKAAHITELRTIINVIRAYYGLGAVSWAAAITAGTSSSGWAAHVAEMQSAIDDVVTLVNAWDASATANLITEPAWIIPDGKRPQANVMEQLRSVIVTL